MFLMPSGPVRQLPHRASFGTQAKNEPGESALQTKVPLFVGEPGSPGLIYCFMPSGITASMCSRTALKALDGNESRSGN